MLSLLDIISYQRNRIFCYFALLLIEYVATPTDTKIIPKILLILNAVPKKTTEKDITTTCLTEFKIAW